MGRARFARRERDARSSTGSARELNSGRRRQAEAASLFRSGSLRVRVAGRRVAQAWLRAAGLALLLGAGAAQAQTNNAPTVATPIPDQTAKVDTAFSFQFEANTFNDADGDTLSYTATQSDGSALPAWLGFTDSTRTFAGTPAATDGGTVTVTVTASDGTDSVSDDFDIVVTTRPLLVSNTGQVVVDTGARSDHLLVGNFRGANTKQALIFTTGDNAGGYTLGEVDVRLSDNLLDRSMDLRRLRVSIWSVSSSDVPDSSLYTLTNPSRFSNDAVNTFTAPENSTLTAETDYAVYFETTSNRLAVLRATASDNQDSGAASGWSIANTRLETTDDGTNWSTVEAVPLIAITGTASAPNNAPVFASAAVTREVAENTAAGGNVGAAVTATDADSDTLTYTLGGTDASSFELGASSGQITVGTGTTLNFEGSNTSYEVEVTASDGTDDATATVTINVTDVAEKPSAPSAPTVSATSGSTTSLDVSWSAPTNTGPSITDYDWRWKVTTASTWTAKTDTTTTATTAAITGLTANTAYHVQVRAKNDEGTGDWSSSGSGTTSAPTNNAPTVANAIPDQAATVDEAFSYTFPANTFNDADNDTLTYSATKSDGTALPAWLIFTDSSREFSGTPAVANAGTFSVTVTATDGTASASDTFDLLVNRVPTVANAIPDQTATADKAFSYTFPADTFNDADNHTLTYSATKSDDTALPAWLTLTDSTRTFAGTPAAANAGTLSVKVTATDGTDSASDTFDIVINRAPTFTNTTVTRSVAENTGAGGNVGAAVTATDGDNDTLTYTLGGTDASSFEIDSSSGQITVGAGTSLDFEGTKTSYAVTVTASDTKDSATANVTINVTDVDEAPRVGATSGSTTSLDVTWTAPANTGSAITDYDWRWKLQTATDWEEKTDTTTTATTATIGGLAESTAYHVQVRAESDEGTSGWSPSGGGRTTNNAPTVANAIPDQLVTAGTPFSYQFPANTFNDADGQTLNYAATRSNGAALPSWLTFTASSRMFAGTPAEADGGTLSVKVTADDGTESVSDIFDIVVNNVPSFASGTVTRSVAENTPAGSNVGAAVTATDANIDPLTYTLGGADASSFDIDSSSGQITVGVRTRLNFEGPKNSFEVEVTASDGTDSATATVTINVTDVDEKPSAPEAPTVSATSGSTTSLDVSWSPPATTGPPITGYELRWKLQTATAWSEPVTVSADPTSTAITELTENTAYHVQVRAGNDEGTSGWSLSGSGTTNSPTNNAPTVANPIPDVTATAGTAFSHYEHLGGERVERDGWVFPHDTFYDADGDTLTYTAAQFDDRALPGWLSFTGSTRTFSGTPAAADAGVVSVKVTADDGNGGTVSDLFGILVEVSPPVPPPPLLVSNTGQADGGTASLENDHAQAFVTGRHPSGYRLTSVALQAELASGGTAPTYTVTVREADASGNPGTEVGTLTQQGSLPGSAALVQFSAAWDGLLLDPDTSYFVQVDVTGGASSTAALGRTTAQAEDSGGAVGFRIGNSRRWKSQTDTAWSVEDSNLVKIAVHGHPNPLVGNIGQAHSGLMAFSTTLQIASGFTTGNHRAGYTLTGVDLLIYPSIPPGTNDTEPDYTVSVWSSGTDGDPGGNLGTLTNPASLINGTNTLASSTGIHLEAGTTYFLVFEASRRGNRDPYIQLTASDDEDAGAGAGWSIATAALARFKTGGAWTASADGSIGRFAVHGHRNWLVGNAGQDDAGGGSLANDHAQAFTTGSEPSGYRLKGVELELGLASGTAPTYTVTVRSSNASNEPDETAGGNKGALTQQGSLVTGDPAFIEFAAAGDGIALDADTTYWLLFDVTGGPNMNATIGRVHGGGEDSNGAGDWTIANQRLFRQSTAAAWSIETSTAPVLKLAVAGIKTPPANSAPQTALEIGTRTLPVGVGMRLGLLPYFSDPDGEQLDYAVKSSAPAVASVSVDGWTLTVRGVAAGTAVIEVTASDPAGEWVTQRFVMRVGTVQGKIA